MTLFPFLAVLMCAMGALALLLVVINRHSRLLAIGTARSAVAATVATVPGEELQRERENVQWRTSQLQISRQQTEAQLAEARLRLSHIEDHARRLRDQISQIQRSLAGADHLGTAQRRKEAEAELGRMKTQLALAEQQLAEARRAAQERPRSYAVIPYEGPHQTRRRPIYLECRADAILLQPEGIVLTADDFEGPLGPGNPLDAALRAVQEHLLRSAAGADLSTQPYPLLLVRPDGIEAYYAALAAMTTWGTEFGYELIGQDWTLRFPPPDHQLAGAVREVVASARIRQQRLIAAAPREYANRRSSVKYRAAPFRGGVVPDGGAADDDRLGYTSRSGSGRVAGRAGPTGGPGRGWSQATGTASHLSPGAATASDDSQRSNDAGAPARPEGFVAGRPPREDELPKDDAVQRKVAAAPRPGEWFERPPPLKKRPDEKDEKDKKKEPPRSLAETRGRDWGLPEAARGSVGITRPVRVDCFQGHLSISSGQGTVGAKVIPLGERTEQTVDAFISAVWEHMDSWGIAGRGMYWRPLLDVHVAPNGEARFEELKALLDGSGLDIRRKHEG